VLKNVTDFEVFEIQAVGFAISLFSDLLVHRNQSFHAAPSPFKIDDSILPEVAATRAEVFFARQRASAQLRRIRLQDNPVSSTATTAIMEVTG
jgi:hypothetical protein